MVYFHKYMTAHYQNNSDLIDILSKFDWIKWKHHWTLHLYLLLKNAYSTGFKTSPFVHKLQRCKSKTKYKFKNLLKLYWYFWTNKAVSFNMSLHWYIYEICQKGTFSTKNCSKNSRKKWKFAKMYCIYIEGKSEAGGCWTLTSIVITNYHRDSNPQAVTWRLIDLIINLFGFLVVPVSESNHKG